MLSRFKKKQISRKLSFIAKEQKRVAEKVAETASAFTEKQIEESKRVESNYSETVNDIFKSRFRANSRFEVYQSMTDAALQSEIATSTTTYSTTADKYKSIENAEDIFQEKARAKMADHDVVISGLYEEIDAMIKSSVTKLEMQLVAMIISQQNLINTKQELAREDLFDSFVEHHRSEVFSIPVFGEIRDLTKKLHDGAAAASSSSSGAQVAGASSSADAAHDAALASDSAEWVLYFDEASNHSYYYNLQTNESVWEEDASSDIVNAAQSSPPVKAEAKPEPRVTSASEFDDIAATENNILLSELQESFDTIASEISSNLDSFFASRLQSILDEMNLLKGSFVAEVKAEE